MTNEEVLESWNAIAMHFHRTVLTRRLPALDSECDPFHFRTRGQDLAAVIATFTYFERNPVQRRETAKHQLFGRHTRFGCAPNSRYGTGTRVQTAFGPGLQCCFA